MLPNDEFNVNSRYAGRIFGAVLEKFPIYVIVIAIIDSTPVQMLIKCTLSLDSMLAARNR